jgi:hypothetical protein
VADYRRSSQKKKTNYTVMKKNVLFMLLLLLFAGCEASDLKVSDDGAYDSRKYINVTVAVEDMVETRGTPINSVLQMIDFGFFCSHTGAAQWNSATDTPEKMHNQRMVRNTTTGFWEYDGSPVEWESETAADNYTFFANAPFATPANGITVTSSKYTAGIPTLSYTVPVNVKNQPDLMIAVPKKNIHPTGHPIALQMKHALTAVGFMVYGSGTVTGISVTGVYVNGNLSMDGSNIAWNITGNRTALDFSSSIAGGSFTFDSPTPINPLSDDGYLMMIPQTLTDDAKVKITVNGIIKELDLLDATPQWEAGKLIIYSIKLS